MSKNSCKAAESAIARFCEWRGLNCYIVINFFQKGYLQSGNFSVVYNYLLNLFIKFYQINPICRVEYKEECYCM